MNLTNNKIVPQYDFLENIASQALDLSKKYSVETEVSVTKTTGITVSTRYGKLDNVEFNNNSILEITVFRNQKKGMASSNDFSKLAIARTVDAAINISYHTYLDSCVGIADKELLAFQSSKIDLFYPINLSTELGVTLAGIAEQTALSYDKHIVATEGSKFNSYYTTKVFGNSHGMLQSYSISQHSLFCSVIAKNNNSVEQSYAYTISCDFDDLRTSEWIGTKCAQKTLKRLDSRKLKTMDAPVLFHSEIAASLFNHLARAIHGDNVYRKSTFLLNDLGQKIFPTWLSINEYPHMPKGLGSAPFDNEGVKTSDRIIINNGVLNNWLLNSYSARKMKLKSTGHANGIYNWHVSCQNINFKDLIKHMYCGLIVTDIMGQGVSLITGNYSRGVSGFWVENGNIQYPVSEITIAGNLKEMYKNIDSISNDFETNSNIHCGSVLISSMKIAGV